MGTFIRTFIVTLIICIVYYVYIFVGKESYSPELTPNETSITKPVEVKAPAAKPDKVEICLLNTDNKPVIVKRAVKQGGLEAALNELLEGTENSDRLNGSYTEIPTGTRLLSFKDKDGAISINLSREFEGGGGAQSVQARLLQLVKTVNLYTENKPVYLYIEGVKAEYIGGEGIYVEQPLNEEKLKF